MKIGNCSFQFWKFFYRNWKLQFLIFGCVSQKQGSRGTGGGLLWRLGFYAVHAAFLPGGMGIVVPGGDAPFAHLVTLAAIPQSTSRTKEVPIRGC